MFFFRICFCQLHAADFAAPTLQHRCGRVQAEFTSTRRSAPKSFFDHGPRSTPLADVRRRRSWGKGRALHWLELGRAGGAGEVRFGFKAVGARLRDARVDRGEGGQQQG